MSKKLDLTAGEILRQKTVSDRVRRLGEEHHAEVAFLRSKMMHYEEAGCPSKYCSLF